MNDLAEDWEYAFDELGQFKDMNHLAHMIVDKCCKIVPNSKVHFFTYSKKSREYREEDKESFIPLAENLPLITYLALNNRIIDVQSLKSESFFETDEVARFLLLEQLSITVLMPFVYRYRLLGFLAISMEHPKQELNGQQRNLLTILKGEAVLNLHAALLVEERFAALEGLDDIGSEFSSYDGIDKICEILFKKLSFILDFQIGTLYLLYRDGRLVLHASTGLNKEERIPALDLGESISGHVAKTNKPLLIKKLQDNEFYSGMNKELYLSKSIIAMPLRTKEYVVGVLTLKGVDGMGEYTLENLHLVSIFVTFLSAAIEKIRLYASLEKGYLDTMRALANSLDAKDSYTQGHSTRVMQYSVGIAEEMGFDKARVNVIRYAALLHDIGKIGIDDAIIRKQYSLTDEEFEIVKKHPLIGERILDSIDFLEDARTYIKYHHERVDGTGYFALKNVPIEAQIINIADAFDAMNSDRPYRKSLGPVVSIQRLVPEADKQFDGKCLDALIAHLKKMGILTAEFAAAP